MNTINNSDFQAAFINITESPVSEKHICYYTTKGSDNTIVLNEVYEANYWHPDTDAIILPVLRVRRIDSQLRTVQKAGPLVVLEAAQNTVHEIYK